MSAFYFLFSSLLLCQCCRCRCCYWWCSIGVFCLAREKESNTQRDCPKCERLNCTHQCLFYCGEAKWRIDDAIFRIAILICSQGTFGILFSPMCDVHVENIYIKSTLYMHMRSIYQTVLFFCRHNHEAFSMSPFFSSSYILYWMYSFTPFVPQKFACVNIKLYYCIFWLCLVATLFL